VAGELVVELLGSAMTLARIVNRSKLNQNQKEFRKVNKSPVGIRMLD
jgi:hypothetical protein